MAETALIAVADVNAYRQVDTKIDSTRFASFVMQVQRTNLRNLLGDALYYALMADARSAGIYADLLNGKDYTYQGHTIRCYGLKPILAYWWLALEAREGELFHSGYGTIELVNNPQQNFESAKNKERIAASYTETAQGYANDLIQFLNDNAATYPLWIGGTEANESHFVSFKI
jgi:hypothetical protein